jgi:WG containing repeat
VKGKKAFPAQYDNAYDFIDGLAVVGTDPVVKGYQDTYGLNKWGVINKTGIVVVPLQYDNIFKTQLGFIEVGNGAYPNEKIGVFNRLGKQVLPLEYAKVHFLPNRILAAKTSNGSFALFDGSGNQLTDFIINTAGYYNETTKLFPVYQTSNNTITGMGFMDLNGKMVIPYKYHQADNFFDGYAMVANNKKWGIIDEKDKVIVPLQYEAVGSRFTGGWFSVKQNGKWTFINKEGKYINGGQAGTSNTTPAPSTNNKPVLDNEYVYSQRVGKFLLVNKGGYFSPMKDSIAGGKWGMLDANNKVIIPAVYDMLLHDTTRNLLFALQNWKVSITSSKGLMLDTTQNSKVGILGFDGKEKYPFTLSKFGAQKDSGKHINVQGLGHYKWGVLNSSCKLIVPMQYDLIYDFTDSIIAAKKNGKFGIINLKNEILIPFEYDSIYTGGSRAPGGYQLKKNGISIWTDAKGKQVKSAPEPYESNFQNALQNARSSSDRAVAFNNFINGVYNQVDTATFSGLVKQKVAQIAAVDFFALHESLMKNKDPNQSKMTPFILNCFNVSQRTMISAYSQCLIDNYKRFTNKLPELPCPPSHTLQPGQPWRE